MCKIKSVISILITFVLMVNMGTLIINADNNYDAVSVNEVFPFDT